MSIAEDFDKLDTDRTVALNRKREHAALTISSLLPYEGHTIHMPLEVPYSTVPAEGINSLAARITSVVFPLNGQSIFELMVNEPFVPQGRDDSDLVQSFRRFESAVMNVLAPTNLRSSVHLAYKQLITLGDTLLHMDDDFQFRVFRPDQFVVRRKHEGQWQEIILVEAVLPEWEPDLSDSEGFPDPISPTVIPTAPQGEQWEALYTRIRRTENNKFEVTQEHRGREVGRRTYEVCPYFLGRWNTVSGEPYGTSLVEDMFGEIRVLDALSKALLDLSLLNAEHRWGVNPAGITEIQDLLDSVNGEFVGASPNDVFPMQFANNPALQSLFATVKHREEVVGRRFLMNSAVQPQGERVTAFQVSVLAQELESMLGGILSSAARDLQEPILRRVLYVMGQKDMIPRDISSEIEKAGGYVKIRIRAGLEILNREAERAKLDQALQNVRNLPPDATSAFNWSAIGKDWWESMGLESTGRIYTEEEIAQQQAAAQQQAMQMQAAQAGMEAGVRNGEQSQ